MIEGVDHGIRVVGVLAQPCDTHDKVKKVKLRSFQFRDMVATFPIIPSSYLQVWKLCCIMIDNAHTAAHKR